MAAVDESLGLLALSAWDASVVFGGCACGGGGGVVGVGVGGGGGKEVVLVVGRD